MKCMHMISRDRDHSEILKFDFAQAQASESQQDSACGLPLIISWRFFHLLYAVAKLLHAVTMRLPVAKPNQVRVCT